MIIAASRKIRFIMSAFLTQFVMKAATKTPFSEVFLGLLPLLFFFFFSLSLSRETPNVVLGLKQHSFPLFRTESGFPFRQRSEFEFCVISTCKGFSLWFVLDF